MNPLELSASDVEYWSQRALEKFKSEYMTAKEVEEVYKVSMSRQTQLIKSKKVIVVNDSQRVYYERSFAVWFFSAYVAKQTAKVSTREAKKETKARKPGRPKSNKGQEWRNTVFNGWEINIPEEFESPKKWVEHIHRIEMKKYQFYPAYQSAEHMAWLETWRALKQHFGIPEVNLCI